jgi:hypothetical protein
MQVRSVNPSENIIAARAIQNLPLQLEGKLLLRETAGIEIDKKNPIPGLAALFKMIPAR